MKQGSGDPNKFIHHKQKKALAQITKAKNYRKKTQQKAQVKAHLNPAKMHHATKKEA
ncbi:hypothetical protein HCN_0026 [Helicobacter cinaedi PAGU611]|nr:hypothetical protein HCN_0026 [Helicobacter cinaedi PAGU611]